MNGERGRRQEMNAMDQPPAIVQFEASSLTIANLSPSVFELYDDKGQVLVSVSMKDGSITYGPNYRPDDAARIFWQAIEIGRAHV